MLKPCAHCGSPFYSSQPKRIYCSARCRNIRDARVKLARKLSGVIPPSKRERACAVCKMPFFSSSGTAKVCGQACGAERDRLRLLERYARAKTERAAKRAAADGIVIPKRSTKYASDAERIAAKARRDHERHLKNMAAGEKARAAIPTLETIACHGCAHWLPEPRAELGAYCGAGRWLTCKPFSPGLKPYEPRKVAANG